MENKELIFAPEEIQIVYQEKLLFQNSGQALKEAAQGGGGITVPGNAQKLYGCGTEGYDLMGKIDGRWTAGLGNLVGLFQHLQFCDSMIKLDVCEEFYTVLHSILVCKLESHGFDGCITLWIRRCLEGCKVLWSTAQCAGEDQ